MAIVNMNDILAIKKFDFEPTTTTTALLLLVP